MSNLSPKQHASRAALLLSMGAVLATVPVVGQSDGEHHTSRCLEDIRLAWAADFALSVTPFQDFSARQVQIL